MLICIADLCNVRDLRFENNLTLDVFLKLLSLRKTSKVNLFYEEKSQ